MSNNREAAGGKGVIWIALGLLMIAAALALVSYNWYDDLRAEQSAWHIISGMEQTLEEESKTPVAVEASEEAALYQEPAWDPRMEMPVKTVDGVEIVGILRIPSLELELPVISQWSYPSLQTAPCRYSGSAYQNNLILCGHNYPAHFGNLKKLKEGDIITFADVDGNLFTYEMTQRETLMPTAFEDMIGGDWDLTLFTCTVGGESRVTVRCMLSEQESGFIP